MSCSDFVTCYDVSGLSNASGVNNGTGVPITGPYALWTLDYTNGAETSFVVYFEIGETSSSGFQRLKQFGTGTGVITFGDTDGFDNSRTGCWSLNAQLAGGSNEIGQLAGPWLRPVVDITGSPDATTDITIKVAFSGAAR